ncbi:patatin-like phospholipase family protein [Nocardioides sp. WL0053]|uniref:Patatin-like phospholipase family protein n=1 Tax=Nocardioides jiangsuensis TaxID=2866161 RepID=A0ABS7RIP7_9ACTN|nr:patatin-like phospholipase family protein [Nocardioides jiangsuensis]MBY9074923.1 patatin-like phospholipase family protein [Nocardioides jiangsuensis]
MARVGLVLGAGGVVGQAYHAGVLAALEHDVGWDPRGVDVVVGTSAGSITGTLLRSGVPASELAAWAVRAPLAAEGHLLAEWFGEESPVFEPFRLWDVVRRPPALPGRHMVQRALVRPWHFRPMTAALALLAPGRSDITEQLTALREVEGRDWPEQDLWICAVRRRDGRRVVFGREGTPQVPLHLAVASSCAVPGYFAPVHIGHDSYVDGGAHSPTNAATLRGRELDLVVVVSPMSGPSGLPRDPYGTSRWHAGRLARREVRALRAEGTTVVALRPGEVAQRAMGNDFMSGERVEEIVQAAFFEAGAYAAQPEVRELLAPLRD